MISGVDLRKSLYTVVIVWIVYLWRTVNMECTLAYNKCLTYKNVFFSTPLTYCSRMLWIFILCIIEPAPSLPFQIKRSKTNNLPVYVDKKRGGSLVLTVIRNIKGDLNVRFRNILLIINEMEAGKLGVFVSDDLKYPCSISLYCIMLKIIIS